MKGRDARLQREGSYALCVMLAVALVAFLAAVVVPSVLGDDSAEACFVWCGDRGRRVESFDDTIGCQCGRFLPITGRTNECPAPGYGGEFSDGPESMWEYIGRGPDEDPLPNSPVVRPGETRVLGIQVGEQGEPQIGLQEGGP